MLGNVDRLRGVSAAEALNTKFEIAHSLHLLLARDKDKNNDPSNHIKTGVGRRPTPTSRTWHFSKFRPHLPTNLATNLPGTIGAEFM